MSGGKRRYQIFLKSETEEPIDVYLMSETNQEVSEIDPELIEHQLVEEEELCSSSINHNAMESGSPISSKRASLLSPLSPEGPVDSSGFLKISSPASDYYLNMCPTEGLSD